MKTTTTDTHIKAEMTLERLAAMADNGQKLFGQRNQHGIIEPSSLQWAVSAPFTDSEVVASVQSFLDANDESFLDASDLTHELAKDGELHGKGDSALEYHIPRFVVEISEDVTLKQDVDSGQRYFVRDGENVICEAFVVDDCECNEQMHNAGYVPTDRTVELQDGFVKADFTLYVMASDAKNLKEVTHD